MKELYVLSLNGNVIGVYSSREFAEHVCIVHTKKYRANFHAGYDWYYDIRSFVEDDDPAQS